MTYMEDMNRRRNYEYSRPLDAHRWSEHPEVNVFVDRIYEEHIRQSSTNTQIKKKHLKVVLLDLYVAWSDDPSLNIAVYMSRNAYSDGTVRGKANAASVHQFHSTKIKNLNPFSKYATDYP